MVLQACAGSREALQELGQSYWPAVYSFLRRKGFSPHDAEEVTQETFSRILAGGRLVSVNPGNGRFRSFLCACAQHEASHFRSREGALKRGANHLTSLQTMEAEHAYQSLPLESADGDAIFDRTWSIIVVNRAINAVRTEYDRLSKRPTYDLLAPLLSAGMDRGDFRKIAEKLETTEGNARVIWLRFRTSFIEQLRREVEQTLYNSSEVDGELRYLMGAWLASHT
jgi:RNA polymerase sigma factor (sigma-70 family)